jgi:hypothetical protein
VTQKPFGRRVSLELRPSLPREEPRASSPRVGVALAQPPVDRASLALGEIAPSHDDELREWREARKRRYQIPWRQVLLMASLCFSVAAFVLPDTVSDDLDWLLYGLMAASFIAGIRRRRQGK